MSRKKSTTCPSDMDNASHHFSSSSNTCDESGKSDEERRGIINKILNYILKQKWWVVMIFAIIGIVSWIAYPLLWLTTKHLNRRR